VTSVLRVLGLSGERHFVNFHRVLSRAVWSLRLAIPRHPRSYRPARHRVLGPLKALSLGHRAHYRLAAPVSSPRHPP
jgi:hypothetical protein